MRERRNTLNGPVYGGGGHDGGHAVSSDKNEIGGGEVRRQRGRKVDVLVKNGPRWVQRVCLQFVKKILSWRLTGGEEFAGQDWLAAHDRLGRRRPPFQRYRRPDAQEDPG